MMHSEPAAVQIAEELGFQTRNSYLAAMNRDTAQCIK